LHIVNLVPNERDDGRVLGMDLLGRDLRTLELVTLSAYETALGWFDIADNLSGFPATLIECGVQCVIGTRCQVESGAAKTFFTTLYRELIKLGNAPRGVPAGPGGNTEGLPSRAGLGGVLLPGRLGSTAPTPQIKNGWGVTESQLWNGLWF
jgi:hypothetical protein